MQGFNEHIKASSDGEAAVRDPAVEIWEEATASQLKYWEHQEEVASKALEYAQGQLERLRRGFGQAALEI